MRHTKRRIATRRQSSTRRKSSTRKMIKGGCWSWFTKSVSRKSISRKLSSSRKSSSSSSSRKSDENVNLNTKDLGKLNHFFIKDATKFIGKIPEYNDKNIKVEYCEKPDKESLSLLNKYKNSIINEAIKHHPENQSNVFDTVETFSKTYCVTITDK